MKQLLVFLFILPDNILYLPERQAKQTTGNADFRVYSDKYTQLDRPNVIKSIYYTLFSVISVVGGDWF